MYTKDTLLDIAIKHHEYADAQEGIMRSQYRRSALQAEAAALILEQTGIASVEQIGPFGSKALGKGTKVRILKGTVIHTTHPRYDRENPKVAGRTYTVTLHDRYDGYINTHWHPHKVNDAYRNQQALWAGEGGYWCWVDTQFVEIV
jgi:translation initiation factor RLI1